MARHPIWLLKSFEATITPKWRDWLEKYRYSRTIANPNYNIALEELLDKITEKSRESYTTRNDLKDLLNDRMQKGRD